MDLHRPGRGVHPSPNRLSTSPPLSRERGHSATCALGARVVSAPTATERTGMAHASAERIRNVALVGHRGSGKTSVNEALLFEAGAINRLGSVADGTTVADWASDEKEREMSISASLASCDWHDRKINLIDTPGEPSFLADALV